MISFDTVDVDSKGAVRFVAKFTGGKKVILHVDPYQYNVRMNRLLEEGEKAYAAKRPFKVVFPPLYTCNISKKILNQYKSFSDFLVHRQEVYRMMRFHTLVVDVIRLQGRHIDMRDAPCVTKFIFAKKTKHVYDSDASHRK
jgi:hypothetical protein